MPPSFEPARAWVDDVAWLNDHLDDRWTDGPVASVQAVRIGEGFGLSGEVYRLHVDTRDRSGVSLVAKIETVDKIRAAIAIRRHVEAELSESMPGCVGAAIEPGDTGDELGVILMEDISPAVQGDDLLGASAAHVSALAVVVRRLHELAVPEDPELERWRPREPDPVLWAERLATLREHHGDEFPVARWARLELLDEDACSAAAALAEAPARLIHLDPHFDNVLWRPDGSAVLLDWSNARLGPIGFDLAVLVSSSCFGQAPAFRDPAGVLDAYERAGPRTIDSDQLRHRVAQALTVQLRGALGWLARDDLTGVHPREVALRLAGIDRVNRGFDWLDAVA